MRLGHPIQADTDDPEELAKRHRALGLRAAFCPSIAAGDKDRALAARRAFERHDVMIAEVGVWNNLMDADPGKRGENVEAMKAGLALADEVGAQCVVNIAGSLNPDRWDGPHPANLSPRAFELAVANAREIIDAVNPKRAKLTYEMMPFCLPDGPDSYLALIREIDRAAFAAHLDVVNIVNSPRRYFDSAALIRECFEKLGPHIVACHLKDVRLEEGLTVHLNETLVGDGGLDIETYLREVARLDPQPPVLLEHLERPEDYDRARQYVFGLGRGLGIDFES